MEIVLNFILYYIIPFLMISVPIIGAICALIHRNDEEYTEISYFINTKKNDD